MLGAICDYTLVLGYLKLRWLIVTFLRMEVNYIYGKKFGILGTFNIRGISYSSVGTGFVAGDDGGSTGRERREEGGGTGREAGGIEERTGMGGN